MNKLTKEEIIAGIYSFYNDVDFLDDINNMTFFRKNQLRKQIGLLKTNPNNNDKSNIKNTN